MPLIKGKSKKAFEHNVKAEMHAGKPQDQALAISYQIQRKNRKMANGGMVDKGPALDQEKARQMQSGATESGYQPQQWMKNLKEGIKMAAGGMVEDEHAESIADDIMRRRNAKIQDGQVDLTENAEENPSAFRQNNREAMLKENYSESEGLDELDSPMDSNRHAVDLEDEDEHSLSSAVMRRMAIKRGK